jgi:hypothetical protein
LGQGTNGVGGSNRATYTYTSSGSFWDGFTWDKADGGTGGSGGTNGGVPVGGPPPPLGSNGLQGGAGGAPGGGGGAAINDQYTNIGYGGGGGANGAVRIMWGVGRNFPSSFTSTP